MSSVHKTFDTRIFYKICLSLTKRYEVYYVSANAKTEDVSGVHIEGVELPQSRIKRMFSLGRVFRKLIEIDADIYQFHDPELLYLGLKLKHRGKKVIFDSHEDVPQQLLEKGYYPSWCKKPISFIYTLIEKYCLKRYDAVISVTPSIVERLATINPLTVMVTNYPPFEEAAGNQRVTGGGVYLLCRWRRRPLYA